MLPADDERAAREAVPLVADPRVRHFYDGQRLVGRAIAAALGMDGAAGEIAWDRYLFYGRDARNRCCPDTTVQVWRGRG
jgi:hypothetical protein